MKRSFLLSEQGVVNIYFIRDANPRIQWLIDLGIPNFTVFMLELPVPEDNPAHMEIVFHEGTALILEQIKAFFEINEFEGDGGLINTIIKTIKQTEISFISREPLNGYEILFPLSKEFFNKVVDRMVRQKVASRESEAAKSVWKAPSVGGRYVPLTPMAPVNKSQKALEEKVLKIHEKKTLDDARKIIQQYKNNIYKNTPGPLFVTLYDRNGKPRGVSRVTNKGLTKWANQCKTAEEVVEIAEDVLESMPLTTEGIKHPKLYHGDASGEMQKRLEERLGRKLELLGRGSSRMVLALDQHSCVKLARNTAGIAQNKAEYRAYQKVEDCSIITRVFYYDEKFRWLISERVLRHPNRRDWAQYGVGSAYEFVEMVRDAMDEDAEFVCPDRVAQASLEFLFRNGVDWGDIKSDEQWGVVRRDGETYPVLVDYGLTDAIYQKHYGSKQAGWDGHINGEFWLDGNNPKRFVDCGGGINHETYAKRVVLKDKAHALVQAILGHKDEWDEDEVEEIQQELAAFASGDDFPPEDLVYTLAWGYLTLDELNKILFNDYDLFHHDIRVFFMKHYNQIRVIDAHFETWEWSAKHISTVVSWLVQRLEDDPGTEHVMVEQWKDGHRWVGMTVNDLLEIKSPGALWRTQGMKTAASGFEIDDGPNTPRYIEVDLESRFGNWNISVDSNDQWLLATLNLDSREQPMLAKGKDPNSLQQDIRNKIDWHYYLLKTDLKQEISQGHKHNYTYMDLEKDNARIVQEMLHEIGRRIDPKPDPANSKRRWPRR